MRYVRLAREDSGHETTTNPLCTMSSTMSYAPRRLQFVLRAALAMPEPPRRLLSKVTRTEQVYLAVDQATRDAYPARAGADG